MSAEFFCINDKAEEVEKSRKVSEDWFSKEANIGFAAAGTGMGWQGVIISYHKNFSTLASLERRIRVDLSEYIGDTAAFAIDLNPGIIAKKIKFQISIRTRIITKY